MPLELSQLYALKDGRYDPVVVSPLPEVAATYLRAKIPQVYLSRVSLQHIHEEHPDVTFFDLLMAPLVLRNGLLIGSKDHVIAGYQMPGSHMRYKAVIKVARGGYDVWLTTFHRTSRGHTKSLLRRGVILQKHIAER